MSCCGSRRAAERVEAGRASGRTTAAPSPTAVEFEYAGSGQLAVTGPLTGTVYRFVSGGGAVRVHGPDAPSLAMVAGLRRTR